MDIDIGYRYNTTNNMIFGLSENEVYPIHGSFNVTTMIDWCFFGYPLRHTNPYVHIVFTSKLLLGSLGANKNGLVDRVKGQLPGLRLVALAAQTLACAYERGSRNGDHMADM